LDRNGFKRSESGFDTNKTNPFLSISIHFRLLGGDDPPGRSVRNPAAARGAAAEADYAASLQQ